MTDCPKCDGRGYFEHQVRVDHFKREKCEHCDGSGTVEGEAMIETPTILERLAHFEKHQLEEGDEYGAEVLHRAQATIQECLDAIVYHRKGGRGASPRVASSWFLNLLKRHGRVKPVEGEDLDAFVRPEVDSE